ncbi:MAG: pyridoxamine 5'-phosphate oxidase family protein [Butyricicoccus sp.]|nr:pyridoxamine 5'-phosphate oxidase family protein [Butyricicoccus sp.]
MRRKDRERDAEFAWRVFENAPYATLSTVNAEGAPCCVPISPARIEDALYFHCALAGEKLDNLTRNPAVCLSAVSRTEVIGEKLTVGYDSAVMHGKAKIVTDPHQRKQALYAITERYCPEQMSRFGEEFEKFACQTVVVRIDPDVVTGKSNSKE